MGAVERLLGGLGDLRCAAAVPVELDDRAQDYRHGKLRAFFRPRRGARCPGFFTAILSWNRTGSTLAQAIVR